MKCFTAIVIATIGLLNLQYCEARFLNLGILDNIGNKLENIRDKIKDRIEQHWGAQVVTQPPLVFEQPPTTAAAEEIPDFHFPEEEAVNEIPEVTTVVPEETTEAEGKRIIEVPLINGGCPAGYRRVGDRCREVFSGRRRRRR